MTKLRAAFLLLLTAALTAGAPAPTQAIVDYSAGPERVVEAAFHLTDTVDIGVRAVLSDAVGGAGTNAPAQTSESSACITLSNPSQSVAVHCGPATITVDPTLAMATVAGSIRGYDFTLTFTATEDPQLILEPGLPTTAIGIERAGTADLDISGNEFTANTRGSSWYAEVQERLKATASGQ